MRILLLFFKIPITIYFDVPQLKMKKKTFQKGDVIRFTWLFRYYTDKNEVQAFKISCASSFRIILQHIFRFVDGITFWIF